MASKAKDEVGKVEATKVEPTKPEGYEGCPCIAHNVETRDIEYVERGVPVEFGAASTDAASTNFSTLGSLWNGSALTIPVTGIYYSEVSFVRNYNATKNDVLMGLFARVPGTNGPTMIGEAWAGVTADYDRQAGHYSIVTKFDAGTELFLAGRTYGDEHGHIISLNWTTFQLCCNPSLAVPKPC